MSESGTLSIIERLNVIESASPDFPGVNDGGCHTWFHRNPDGPEAAQVIEELVGALEGSIRKLRKCSLAHGNSEEFVDIMLEPFVAALAKVRTA